MDDFLSFGLEFFHTGKDTAAHQEQDGKASGGMGDRFGIFGHAVPELWSGLFIAEFLGLGQLLQ